MTIAMLVDWRVFYFFPSNPYSRHPNVKPKPMTLYLKTQGIQLLEISLDGPRGLELSLQTSTRWASPPVVSRGMAPLIGAITLVTHL